MARSASTFIGGTYTREIVAGEISNAYNIPLNQGVVYVLGFSLDLAGSAKVGDGSAGTIEFYVRFPQTGINNPHAVVAPSSMGGSGNGQGGNSLWLQTGSRLRWQVNPPGPTEVQDWSPDLINPVVANTFHHLVIQTSGNGTWYFWGDGVYKGSASDTIGGDDFNFAFSNIHFAKSGDASSQYGGLRFDEIRVSSIQRYTPSNNFTPPSAAFVNDDDTLALFHCDSDSELDDTSIQHNASAALSSAATVSATGLLVQVDEYVHVGYWAAEYTEEIANRFGSANLSAAFTQTAVGALTKDGSSALTSTATVTAVGELRKDGSSALTTTATVTAVGALRKDGSSALTSTATQAVSGELSKDGSSALSVTATQAVSGELRKDGSSALAVTATQAASSAVLKNGQSTLAVTATLSATAQTSDDASVAMSVTATISASAINIKNGIATLNSTATLSASAQDFDIATANLTSAFTLTATSQKIIVGSAAMQSAITMTTVAELLQQANVERTIAVKSETRIIKALQDQRIIPVNSESRINIVLADSRTILVPDETRILKEP